MRNPDAPTAAEAHADALRDHVHRAELAVIELFADAGLSIGDRLRCVGALADNLHDRSGR